MCDVADLETGHVTVRPLTEMPSPRLLDCSIRLSHRPTPSLMKLAQETVAMTVAKPDGLASVTDVAAPRSPFRFTDLPPELRYHILTYTDLVTPYKEVEWNADHGFYYRQVFAGPRGNLYPHLLHGLSSTGYTEDYLRTVEYERGPAPRYISCWESSFPHGCFCRAFHAAYSSSIRCNCWAPPKSIFRVSRSIRDDALYLFYSHNRFIVAPAGGKTWEAVASAPNKIPPSIFLGEVVPQDALRFLRYLEVVFPPFGEGEPCEYCPRGSPQFLDWEQTLKQVEPYLNLSKLTICIYFAEWQPHRDPYARNKYRDNMTNEQSRDVCMSYLYAVGPLRQLNGLGRFFAHFAWPKEWAAYISAQDYNSVKERKPRGDARF